MSDGRKRIIGSECEIGILCHRLWLYLTDAFDRSAFSNYKEVAGQSVKIGTGAQATVAGIGDIVINACVDGSTSTINLNNVLHMPSFGRQLLSVAQIDRRGLVVELKDGKCNIRRKDNVVATGALHGALYILDGPQAPRYDKVACLQSSGLARTARPRQYQRNTTHGEPWGGQRCQYLKELRLD